MHVFTQLQGCLLAVLCCACSDLADNKFEAEGLAALAPALNTLTGMTFLVLGSNGLDTADDSHPLRPVLASLRAAGCSVCQ